MATDIFVYSNTHLDVARDVLEEELESLLGDSGEVTGGGSGAEGWNIDLLIHDDDSLDTLVSRIIAFLREWNVPRDTYLQIIPPDWTPDSGVEQWRKNVYPGNNT